MTKPISLVSTDHFPAPESPSTPKLQSPPQSCSTSPNRDLKLNHSPYHPPTGDKVVAKPNSTEHEAPSVLPFAQLGLRLLGVLMVVDGMGAMFGGGIQWLLQVAEYANAGYSMTIDPHSAGWVAGGIPSLIVGFYLVTGCDTLLRIVFTPSRPQ